LRGGVLGELGGRDKANEPRHFARGGSARIVPAEQAPRRWIVARRRATAHQAWPSDLAIGFGHRIWSSAAERGAHGPAFPAAAKACGGRWETYDRTRGQRPQILAAQRISGFRLDSGSRLPIVPQPGAGVSRAVCFCMPGRRTDTPDATRRPDKNW
jgi:hypothetical protein